MNKLVANIFAFSVLASGAASAALVEVDAPVVVNKLFTTEFKIDQNIDEDGRGSQRGHDIFLREGNNSSGASTNFNWGADFDYNETFDWSLSLSDTGETTLVFEGITLENTALEGTWNGLEFWINQSGREEMSNVLVTTTIDGQLFELPQGDSKGGFTFAMEDFSTFTEISGTLNLSWMADTAVSTPNGRIALSLKALELEPASVPAPATAVLSLLGFGFLAARRVKK